MRASPWPQIPRTTPARTRLRRDTMTSDEISGYMTRGYQADDEPEPAHIEVITSTEAIALPAP